MGIPQTNMRSSYVAVMMLSMLLAGVAVYAATEEVQGLGGLENTADAALADTADIDDEDFDDDELGEGVMGRGGGFLSTTGSFTLSGGSAAGDSEELGEGVMGRGGGFLSTQGSFTLSGGSAAGDSEELGEE